MQRLFRSPPRRMVISVLGLLLLLLVAVAAILHARARPAEIQMQSGFVSSHPDGGAPIIVHKMPLPMGKVLFKLRQFGPLVSYVQFRSVIETNSSDGQWLLAPGLPSGFPGTARGSEDLIWTPRQETDALWRLRIDYTQSIRFQNKHVFTLRRAIIRSPSWPGRSTNLHSAAALQEARKSDGSIRSIHHDSRL